MCYSSRVLNSDHDDIDKTLEYYGVSISEYSSLFNETFSEVINSESKESK